MWFFISRAVDKKEVKVDQDFMVMSSGQKPIARNFNSTVVKIKFKYYETRQRNYVQSEKSSSDLNYHSAK